jgi:hypothetical protein
MLERWQQVYRTGEAGLNPFTTAELAAVSLDLEALPPAERGPYLQAVPLPLSGPGTPPDGTVDPWGPPSVPPGDADDATDWARAVADLTRRGFLRPGVPAPPSGPAPGELAGWAVGPTGQLRSPVTLTGDLAIITRIRAAPVWVAEVTRSPDPGNPDPAAPNWPLAARMYAPHRPPAGLAEPGTPGRRAASFTLLRDDLAMITLAQWCGADLAAAAGPSPAPGPTELGTEAVPTAQAAAAFAALTRLRVAKAAGNRVALRSLTVATGGGRHWLLEGEWWQVAIPLSAGGLGEQISALLKPRPNGASAPGGH